jgi:hypothetical protein
MSDLTRCECGLGGSCQLSAGACVVGRDDRVEEMRIEERSWRHSPSGTCACVLQRTCERERVLVLLGAVQARIPCTALGAVQRQILRNHLHGTQCRARSTTVLGSEA